MGQRFEAYAKMAVPRYTSYPTAPHFRPDIGAEEYAAWLSALDPDAPISLYLHVPYCRQLCWYCGCNMKLASKRAPILEYTDTLIDEVRLVARHLPGRLKVSHVHWGGGTPTALEPDDLARVMEELHQHYEILPDAELAIESDPRTLTREMIDRIGTLGFTRASFGVQEFDASVQMAINRVQPPKMVATAVEGLRGVGVRGINFDLIYGLPYQTVDTITKTIGLVAEMKPDRIALFGYAHVPWMAKRQALINAAALPGPEARFAQAKTAEELIKAAGYCAVGLDHFALPDDPLAQAAENGALRRNFQGYTTDRAAALIGMGTSSIGKTPSGYVQNIPEVRTWRRNIEEGRLPISKGCTTTLQDVVRGQVIEELMCHGLVDAAEVSLAHDYPTGWLANVETGLADLEADGLIRRQGTQVAIRDEARHLVRVVASAFDDYFVRSDARHSVAV